jgi:hypothetical protein
MNIKERLTWIAEDLLRQGGQEQLVRELRDVIRAFEPDPFMPPAAIIRQCSGHAPALEVYEGGRA